MDKIKKRIAELNERTLGFETGFPQTSRAWI